MNTTKLEQSQFPQNLSLQCGTIGWDTSSDEAIIITKVVVAGITDALNTLKNKTTPVAILVQDLKGNRIIFAAVSYTPAESSEEDAEGSWTYFWSYNMDDIPENATIYTCDQSQIQEVISRRGWDMVRMSFSSLSNISTLAVYIFNIIHDSLDQQDVAEGDSYTIELDGFFDATVEVANGVKSFAFLPKGEMKMLIKSDEDTVAQ